MVNEAFAKVYLSSTEGRRKRGRPLGRWKDRVKEYMSEWESGCVDAVWMVFEGVWKV